MLDIGAAVHRNAELCAADQWSDRFEELLFLNVVELDVTFSYCGIWSVRDLVHSEEHALRVAGQFFELLVAADMRETDIS